MRFVRWIVCFGLAPIGMIWGNEDVVRLAVPLSLREPIQILCKQFQCHTQLHCHVSIITPRHLYAQVIHGIS